MATSGPPTPTIDASLDALSRGPSHIVGLGASAGGLEALEHFFANMPAQNGMAFVVAQHLSPDFKSLMDQLLGRHTRMVIRRVENGMPVEADTIYLIPPRADIAIANGALRLSDPTRSERGLHLPIDTLLASLAEDAGDKAIGIVLSGTGSDGTRGIRAIKEAGGMVMVQEAETAQFDGMPRSALATGLADYVLAPAQMPAALLAYARHPLLWRQELTAPPALTEENQLGDIVALLQPVQGIDFSHYKINTLWRRIRRRLGIVNVPDVDAYVQVLRASPREVNALHKDLLIGVTGFFRDPEAFGVLSREVIAPLIQRASDSDSIRIWVAACATGEEVYSTAMLVREQLTLHDKRPEVQIFATDVDKESIEYAATGVYPESIAADVGAERLQRFFTHHDHRYRVTRELREMVIFAPHNLLKDPPFTKIDLITCRNFLIYLNTPMQKRVLSLLHYALQPQGHLFLGVSGSLGELASEFETVHAKWKCFRKIRDVKLPAATRLPTTLLSPQVSQPPPRRSDRDSAIRMPDPGLSRALISLVEDYCPPSLIINDQREVLWVAEGAAAYLKRPSGAISTDLLRMIIDDLSVPLATALHKAMSERTDVIYTDVRVRTEDMARWLKLRVKGIADRSRGRQLLVISFEESQPAQPLVTASEASFDVEGQTYQRLHDLEHELQYTRENLQAVIEELETSNEELQSTNEEMVAANEELQSTNEELQSVNEELITVNAEYQSKIQELGALNADIDNLLRSTDLGTIFLDRELRIRKFTPAATTFIHLLEQDIGRPLAHCAYTFAQIDLASDAAQVLRSSQPLEKEVATHAGAWFLLRILPFLTAAGMCEGVVLTGVDITRLKNAQEAVNQSQAQLQHIMDHAPAAIYIKDTHGRFRLVNHQFEALLNRPSADILGKTVYDLQPQAVGDSVTAHDRDVLAANAALTFEEQIAISGMDHTFLTSKFPLHDADGRPYAICGIATDITARKQAEAALQDAKGELERRVQELSRLTAILDATTDFVGITDAQGQLLYLNAAGRRLLGLEATAPLTLKSADFIPEQARQLIREEGAPAAQRDGAWAGEIAIFGPEGREIPVSLVLIAHTSEQGEVESFSTVMRDITEQRQTQDLLRHRADEMETFAYDLQAPLRTFEGYARWLLEDYGDVLDAQGRQLCEEIIDDATHMKTLLDGLLEYSRIGRRQTAPVAASVRAVIDWVLHDLQLEIHDSGAVIHTPDALPTVVYPEGRLTQIFSNLISNALKFTADRAPEITISWEEETHCHRFAVRDNGIGIAPEHFERIFEIFKRLHTRETYPGTGAGLTIVKRIVETHGGQIGVTSTPGEGSTFWVTIPRT